MYRHTDFHFLTFVLAAVLPLFHILFVTQILAMENDAPPSAEQPSYCNDNVVRSRAKAIHKGLILAFSKIMATPSDDDGHWEKLLESVPSNHVISSSGRDSSSTSSKKQDNTKVPKLMGVCQRFTFDAEKFNFEFVFYGMPTFNKLMHLWKVPAQQLMNSLQMGEIHKIVNPNGRLSAMDIFMKTADQQFFIKDVKTGAEKLLKKERKALKIWPRAEIDFFRMHQFAPYYDRMMEAVNSDGHQSLLPKFFALFSIKNNSYDLEGEERFFLMTKNLFPEIYKTERQEQQQFSLNLTYKFDVKGSVHNQKLPAEKRKPVPSENGGSISQPTFRYLDLYDEAEQQMNEFEVTKEGCFFRNGIFLEDKAYTTFIDILTKDALLLKKAGKTDYSLLLGITFDQMDENQMEMLKKENSNILVASCENCSADHGQSYSERIDNFTIIPGIIDTLAQFNWRKIIDLVKTSVTHKMKKKAKSTIGPDDYYHRFMCAISTKVFRPRQNKSKLFEDNMEKFCKWVITEPSL